MIIRSATPADVEALLTFWRANAERTTTDEPANVRAVVANPAADVLIAEDGGAIVGTLVATWDGWRGNMYRLAVAEARRRQGIARGLIAAGEESLRIRGARRVAAIVLDDRDYAVGTWRDSGYERADGNGRYLKMLS